jgi:hypothetical protein
VRIVDARSSLSDLGRPCFKEEARKQADAPAAYNSKAGAAANGNRSFNLRVVQVLSLSSDRHFQAKWASRQFMHRLGRGHSGLPRTYVRLDLGCTKARESIVINVVLP